MNKRYAIYIGSLALAATAIILIGWRRKAARNAEAYLNIQEIGNNAGFADKAFESMMKNVGWRGGEAWCMYFAKAVYLDSFPNKAKEIDRVLTGSTQQSWKNALANPDVFKVITDGPPRPGDIAIWQSVNNKSLGHAAIVRRRDHGDEWHTVEGNSGFGGTREGQGVTEGDRTLVPGTVEGSLKLLGFLRLKT